jgi:hypothetical protein
VKPFQNGRFTNREYILAKLARKIGRGHDAIYHGTRHPQEVLRGGRLKPDPTNKVSLSRSPEVAAHFALLPDDGIIRWSPAVLVLNRSSLVQTYRLEPWRYDDDWDDEQEEVIWGRTVSFRRHLLGVVREADLNKVFGPREGKLIRAGRAKVREIIIRDRKRLSTEDARLRTAVSADRSIRRGKQCDKDHQNDSFIFPSVRSSRCSGSAAHRLSGKVPR